MGFGPRNSLLLLAVLYGVSRQVTFTYGATNPLLVYPPAMYANAKYPMPMMSPYAMGGFTSLDPDCPNFTAAECKMRKKKCKSIGSLVSGTSGPLKDLFTCATALSIPKTSFVMAIGPAFAEGRPETIVDSATTDPVVGYHLRRCILMQSGMLGLNDTINRMMLNAKVQTKLGWNPPLATIALEAAENCPEPEDLKYTEYLSCMKRQCIQNLSVASFAFTDPKDLKKDDD